MPGRLFPEFIGGQNEDARRQGIETARKVLELAMQIRGDDDFIAGDLTRADLYLAPILFYVGLTPDKDAVFGVPGLAPWWARIEALPSYKATEPDLG